MVKVRFYLADITYRIVGKKGVLQLYGRTSDGKKIAVHDENFEPYFYVNPGETKLLGLKTIDKGIEYSIVRVEEVKKNVNEKEQKLLKVFVNLPPGVAIIKDLVRPLVKECYEYDIKFVRRYLIDKGLQPMTLLEADGTWDKNIFKAKSVKQAGDDTLNSKILAVDIETYNPLGKRVLPEKHPVIMIALYGETFRKVITWKKIDTKEKYIEFVPSEADLLEKFKDLIKEQEPDILTGYFSDGFDLPYLKTRADKYKIKLDIGVDGSEMKISGRGQTTAQITGIVHVDIYKFIKKIIGRSMETDVFTLDAVSKELLGEQKVPVNLDQLADAWDKNLPSLEEYAKYNLQDTKLTYDLCVKVLPNMIEFVKIIGLPLWDINRMSFSQLVEWFIIKQAPVYDEIVLNRPTYHQQQGRMAARFKGALVFEPKPGLYDNIVVFDYRSLYPSIIASHNISPGKMNCSCCGKKKVPLEGQNLWFCEKKPGFLSSVIEDLIKRRARIKEELKKATKKDPLLSARSDALKVLANSFYGYMGFAPARWYCFECGNSVTAYGRYYITKVIQSAQKEMFTVLYSDTDSVFLVLGRKTKADAMKFVEKINKDLPGWMELEYENFYDRGIFVAVKTKDTGAKKKYAMIDSKGNLKIRGFETVRRNTAFIAKDVQKTVLQIILGEGDKKKAMKLVKSVVEDLRANKVPIEKMVIWTQLTREVGEYAAIGPHVAAAKRMKERGMDVGPGDIVKYVVTRGKGKIRDRVKLEDEVKQDEYDPDYYIDHQIIPAVEKIFAVLGIKADDLTGKGTQSTLGGFS